MEKKEDLRVVKTKENIRNAFLDLLKEERLKDITVKKICSRSKCSRNTFYCHYQYKEDLYDSLINESIDSLKRGADPLISSIDQLDESVIQEYVRNIISEIRKSKELISVLVFQDEGENFQQKLSDKIYDFFLDQANMIAPNKVDTRYRLYIRYITSGLAAFIMEWFFETDLSENEAMDILYEIHRGPVRKSADYLLRP